MKKASTAIFSRSTAIRASTPLFVVVALVASCSREPERPEPEPLPAFPDHPMAAPSDSRWWEGNAPCPGSALAGTHEEFFCVDDAGAKHGPATQLEDGVPWQHNQYWHGTKHGLEVQYGYLASGAALRRLSTCDFRRGLRHGRCVFERSAKNPWVTEWHHGTGVWIEFWNGEVSGVALALGDFAVLGLEQTSEAITFRVGLQAVSVPAL